MDRMTGYEPVDSGSNLDRRIDILHQFDCKISTYIGQVSRVAKGADCKSVTKETPQVRILLCPLFFNSVLKDVSLEENSDIISM